MNFRKNRRLIFYFGFKCLDKSCILKIGKDDINESR